MKIEFQAIGFLKHEISNLYLIFHHRNIIGVSKTFLDRICFDLVQSFQITFFKWSLSPSSVNLFSLLQSALNCTLSTATAAIISLRWKPRKPRLKLIAQIAAAASLKSVTWTNTWVTRKYPILIHKINIVNGVFWLRTTLVLYINSRIKR